MGIAELRALYNEDCTSEEAVGRAAVGHAGLEEKRKRWGVVAHGRPNTNNVSSIRPTLDG